MVMMVMVMVMVIISYQPKFCHHNIRKLFLTNSMFKSFQLIKLESRYDWKEALCATIIARWDFLKPTDMTLEKVGTQRGLR